MFQPGKSLAQLEKETIFDALKFYQGNKSQTAAALGIALKTLYNKLDVYEAEAIKEKEELLKLRQQEKENQNKLRGNQNVTETNGQTNSNGGPGVPTESKLRVESLAKVSEKPGVSLREREKIQKVSSR